MGNLRGSRKVDSVPFSGRANVNDKLRWLQRQINANKPTVENFRISDTIALGTGFTVSNYSFTNTLKGSTLFQEYVLGDKFLNMWLKLNLHAAATVLKLRIILYYPKRVNVPFAPAATAAGFANLPDPSAYKVVHDKVYQSPYSTAGVQPQISLPLRSLETIVNRTNGVVERNEIRMAVLAETSGSSTLNWSSAHYIRNK